MFYAKCVSCNSLYIVMDRTAEFYSRPSDSFRGGSFPVFTGSRRQLGGGILGALKKFFLPISKDLGKLALTSGVNLASDIARDTMMGKSFKDSFLRHGKTRGLDFAKAAVQKASQRMSGNGRRRRRRKGAKGAKRLTRSRKTKTSHKPKTSRKRRKRSKSAHKRSAKRRRIANNF